MGAGGIMGAMSDFDIAYGIVAVDKTSAGINSAVGNTQTGTKSIAEQFFFMSSAINQAIAYINQGFDFTVGAMINWADSMKKASDVTGMTTNDLQRLKAAGLETGVSFDAITTSARMMTQKLGDTGTAGDELRARLAKLGVSTVDANGNLRSTNDIYWDTLRALNSMPAGMERNNLALDTLGRSWYELAPLIREYDKAATAAAQVDVVSEEDIEKAHDYGIELDKLNAKWAKMGRDIGTDFLPATVKATDAIQSFLSTAGKGGENFFLVTRDLMAFQKDPLKGWGQFSKEYDKMKAQAVLDANNARSTAYTGETGTPAPIVEELDKETDRVKELTDAYKDWDVAVKKVNDDKSKDFEDERDYYEGILEADGDYSKIRSLTSSHKKAERTRMATIAEDQATATDAAAEFNAIKAGIPLAQVKGTNQYTTAQAQTTNTLNIQTVKLGNDYKFDDFLKDYQKHLSQQRNLKGIKGIQ